MYSSCTQYGRPSMSEYVRSVAHASAAVLLKHCSAQTRMVEIRPNPSVILDLKRCHLLEKSFRGRRVEHDVSLDPPIWPGLGADSVPGQS